MELSQDPSFDVAYKFRSRIVGIEAFCGEWTTATWVHLPVRTDFGGEIKESRVEGVSNSAAPLARMLNFASQRDGEADLAPITVNELLTIGIDSM
jgi:hypothetical protein